MVSQAIKGADQPRAQWYWKSNSDPWSTNGNEEWTKYADIESAIIEEAFNQKNKIKLAELDNYSINLNDCIQISKSDPNKQRQIKRVLTSRNESQGLREERFFLPPALSKTFNDDWGKEAYIFLSQTRWNHMPKPPASTDVGAALYQLPKTAQKPKTSAISYSLLTPAKTAA
ncbi:unnamed protein product [Didymodactylos carnosus]|uniref:WWE domain-containing protein n=1 Tax=Didymodactylos carnosus TaxID=1234261 RepID=A0A815G8V8_9BILA|nr:unnamed protein product [Didymodactylos carnosus]CAF4193266.1 unnamed protein product [Didymodactylos carnosus]